MVDRPKIIRALKSASFSSAVMTLILWSIRRKDTFIIVYVLFCVAIFAFLDCCSENMGVNG